jgi:hypothetical protein
VGISLLCSHSLLTIVSRSSSNSLQSSSAPRPWRASQSTSPVKAALPSGAAFAELEHPRRSSNFAAQSSSTKSLCLRTDSTLDRVEDGRVYQTVWASSILVSASARFERHASTLRPALWLPFSMPNLLARIALRLRD